MSHCSGHLAARPAAHTQQESVHAMFQVRAVMLSGYRNWPECAGKKGALTPSPEVPAGFGWGECDHLELWKRNRGSAAEEKGREDV